MRTLLPAVLLLGTVPAPGVGQQIAVGSYPLPKGGSLPQMIAAGPDGAIWFAENRRNNVGRISTAGRITEYPIPTGASAPEGITAGADGALWFTEGGGNKVGRITTAGLISEYALPTPDSLPQGIAAGPDGALWFTELLGNNIGRITTAGIVSEYPVPTAGSQPAWIAAGPDGAMWFTEQNGNKIGRITTGGAMSEYAVPTANSDLGGIALGPDAALWFSESQKVGRITTEGAITEYTLAGTAISPVGITAGPDGALWFADALGRIGRITTAGSIGVYPVPLPAPNAIIQPYGIVTGPDGELWFTQAGCSRIGEAVFVTANLTVSPAGGAFGGALTFAGNGFAPHENVRIYVRGVGSAILAAGTADAQGAFTAAGREPQSPYGPRVYLGAGQSSGLLGAAAFAVTARLVLNPTSGPAGAKVSVAGTGFGASEAVDLYWDGLQTYLGLTRADSNGSFGGGAAFTFTVPAGSGTYTVSAFGNSGATPVAPFIVE